MNLNYITDTKASMGEYGEIELILTNFNGEVLKMEFDNIDNFTCFLNDLLSCKLKLEGF